MVIRILLETILEPLFYVVIVWFAVKCWRVYGHDFIPSDRE